jgi:hypothetical protein
LCVSGFWQAIACCAFFAQNALLQGRGSYGFWGVSTPVREAFAQQGNAWLNA